MFHVSVFWIALFLYCYTCRGFLPPILSWAFGGDENLKLKCWPHAISHFDARSPFFIYFVLCVALGLTENSISSILYYRVLQSEKKGLLILKLPVKTLSNLAVNASLKPNPIQSVQQYIVFYSRASQPFIRSVCYQKASFSSDWCHVLIFGHSAVLPMGVLRVFMHVCMMLFPWH